MATAGQLVQVRPINASLLHNTGWFSKKDPYCMVKMGNQSQRTTPDWHGGSHPKWNQTFVFTRTYEDHLKFIVYDREAVVSDDHVGQGELHFVNVPPGVPFEGFVKLFHKGKAAGDLHVAVEYLSQAPSPRPIGVPVMTQAGGMVAQGGYPGVQPQGYPLGQSGAYPPAPNYPSAPYPPGPIPPVTYAQPPSQPYPPVNYPPQAYPMGYPAGPSVIVLEEHRHHHGHHGHHGHHHHHHHRNEGPGEVIVIQQGAYPAPGYTAQPIYSNPQPYPPQPYPGYPPR